MRKRKKGRKFSRKHNQGKMFLRTMAVSFFAHGKIKTTQARAKELAGFAEKQITRAKANNVQCRRLLAKYFPASTVKKIVDEIAPQYKDRKGGYTRIIKLGQRESSAAKMAILELVK